MHASEHSSEHASKPLFQILEPFCIVLRNTNLNKLLSIIWFDIMIYLIELLYKQLKKLNLPAKQRLTENIVIDYVLDLWFLFFNSTRFVSKFNINLYSITQFF